MINLFEKFLLKLREVAPECFAEDSPLKNKIAEMGLRLDPKIIKIVLEDTKLKQHFTTEIDGTIIFDKVKFATFANNKTYYPDSYTQFKNKIGLQDKDSRIIKSANEVVLVWPYKDCMIAAGQTKDDDRHNERFYNEILAADEISVLKEPKVLTNFKRIDAGGEHIPTSVSAEKDNFIIKGNNLLALYSLRKKFAGKVKLIYIDPPYNTGNDSFLYNDRFNHSTWLTFMKNRLEVARELLRDDGCIFVQCDDNEQAYLKVLMDEIFGRENFVATIPRKTRSSATTKSDAELQTLHDYVHVYWKKKSGASFNLKEVGRKEYPYSDLRGKYYLVPLQDNGPHGTRTARPNLYYPIYQDRNDNLSLSRKNQDDVEFLPADHKNDQGRWMWSPKKFLTDRSDLITQNGKVFIKHYFTPLENQMLLQREKGWLIDNIPNKNGTLALNECFGKKGVYAYAKPEELIQFFVRIATNEGDLVLDFCLGSGTTAAVAHKMGRRYIGIEQMDYIKEITCERLKKVISGEQGGISKSVNWQGGGSFVYCELMEDNAKKMSEIENADTAEKLDSLFNEIKDSAYIASKVDEKKIDGLEFGQLRTLSGRRHFLKEILNKNHLYVNYCDIDDETYKVDKADKSLNEAFYG